MAVVATNSPGFLAKLVLLEQAQEDLREYKQGESHEFV